MASQNGLGRWNTISTPSYELLAELRGSRKSRSALFDKEVCHEDEQVIVYQVAVYGVDGSGMPRDRVGDYGSRAVAPRTSGKAAGSPRQCNGVPEPGTVKDIEDTRKQPDPARMHSPEESRQITIGGAQYFVEGEVLKIDDQNYTIKKDETEEQVRLIVNQDTNLDCAEAPTSQEKQSDAVISKRASPEKQAPQAS
jgi:hypothetical protein